MNKAQEKKKNIIILKLKKQAKTRVTRLKRRFRSYKKIKRKNITYIVITKT